MSLIYSVTVLTNLTTYNEINSDHNYYYNGFICLFIFNYIFIDYHSLQYSSLDAQKQNPPHKIHDCLTVDLNFALSQLNYCVCNICKLLTNNSLL